MRGFSFQFWPPPPFPISEKALLCFKVPRLRTLVLMITAVIKRGEIRALDKWNRDEKTEILEETPVPVPHRPPKISNLFNIYRISNRISQRTLFPPENQSVNVVEENNGCLLCKLYGTHKRTACAEYKISSAKSEGACIILQTMKCVINRSCRGLGLRRYLS